MPNTPEKSNWLLLAASRNPEDRRLALELAASIREQIQDELLVLLVERPTFSIAQRIFELLDEEHQSLLAEMEAGGTTLPLRPNHNLAAISVAQERAEKLALLKQTAEGMNFFAHKLLYVRYYREYSGKSMREARDNMERLFHRAKAINPLAGSEDD